MPKKKLEITPEEQSQKFRDAVQRMMDDGILNPIEAERAVDGILQAQAKAKKAK